jgi:hypothetical protein
LKAAVAFLYIITQQLFRNTKSIKSTDAMDKIKSMFNKDKHEDGSSSNTQSNTMPTGGAQSGGNPDSAEGVVLHTNLGDITIALFKDQTPRVSLHVEDTGCMHILTCE